MKCFHRTPHVEKILANGFHDGTYMTATIHRVVWFSDRPLDFGQGAKGDTLLSIEILDDVIPEYEWIEDGKPYREFLIPAEIFN